MSGIKSLRALATLSLVTLLVGCAAAPVETDYTAFREHPPRSILVIPPENQTVEAHAPYLYLSTVTYPLAESGYYVFPVAVIDAFFKDNGLPTPGEMNNVPLSKIEEIVGADAVLYVSIEEWGQKYVVLQSTTVVKARAKLVDVKTGTVLWNGIAQFSEGSSDGGGGLIGMAVAAVVEQIVDSLSDRTHRVAAQANNMMLRNPTSGLLPGPYRAALSETP